MNKRFLQLLVCPVCKRELKYDASAKELICHHDALAFPVNKKRPVLQRADARLLNQVELLSNK